MLRLSGRALKILAGVLLALVVVGAVVLAALPEIIRRVAVNQASKLTGRTVTLDDVDLNVFTGHLALKGLKLAKRGVNERAIELERLDVRVDYLPLLRHDVRVAELAVAGTTVDVVRRGPAEFDFSDILDNLRGGDAPARPSKPAAAPSSWTITIDRVSVRRLNVTARDLTTSPESAPTGLKRGTVKGEVTLDGLEIFQAGRTEPFFKAARLGVKIREADLVARSVVIGAIEIEASAVRAVRDTRRKIDLLALGEPPSDAKGAAPPAQAPDSAGTAGPPPPDFKLRIEQIALRNGGLTFKDEAVKPINTLAITDLSADIKDLSWPVAGPAGFAVTMKMPKSGRVEMKGSVTPVPFDVDFDLTLRDGSFEPYQAYVPVKARFVGTFYGDNRNHITLNNGALTVTSRGRNWIEKFAILAPGQKTPTARFDRLRLDGIDFSWPNYARVSKITLTKPDMRVERDTDGAISLRKLFETDPAKADASRPEAPQPEPAKKEDATPPASPGSPRASPIPIPVDIGMIVIEEGSAQFVDRTTTPPFTEPVSRLGLTIEGLRPTPRRRGLPAPQAVIGGTSAFDLKGEIAPFGEVYADLAGELRDFQLTTVNPYADPLIAWAMKTGQLAIKVHYRIEKNQLTAENEVIVRNLTVAPTRQNDEVKKKIGLPLGMIVALITDADNGIDVNVPLSGELNQVKAGLGDAIWTAVKNALTNVVAAPFRSIGKLFKGKGDSLDELQVDPVTFAAGSADVAPEMAKHLTDVAGFLKKAPMIKFALAPVAAPRDMESLKAQEVTLKVLRLQKERGLPDFDAAVAAVFKAALPGVKPPDSGEAQLAALRERQPLPDAQMNELLERRVAAVRAALTKTEGIPAERLVPGPAQPPSSDEAAEGRIEFQIEQ